MNGRRLTYTVVAALCGFSIALLGLPAAAGAASGCANEKLRAEQPYGLELPDCRAYEMVSPPNKNGNDIATSLGQAATDGEAVTYDSSGSFGEPAGAELYSRYVSRRSPGGWSTKNVTPRPSAAEASLFTPFEQMVFSPTLTKGALSTIEDSLTNTPAGYDNIYVADLQSGAYEDATPIAPPGEQPYSNSDAPILGGASSDLSSVMYTQRASLTPEASPESQHVYDWSGESVHLVDIAPSGAPFTGEASIGAGGYAGYFSGPANPLHAISSDGRRVFFTASEAKHSFEGQLYVRENPAAPQSPVQGGKCTVATDACTIEVSASQRQTEDPQGPKPARYWGASVDGSRVFFTSNSELTEDAYTGPTDNAPNLYEYDVGTGALTDLTVDSSDAQGAAVTALVSMGEDGSYVYFVAGGKLAANENSHHDTASAGQPNLYVYHGGEVTFIATLAGAASTEGNDEKVWNFYGSPEHKEAHASADGAHLAFVSQRELTGYDNEPVEPFACRSEHCPEVYLYNAAAGQLVCASCDPENARPNGPAEFGVLEEERALKAAGAVQSQRPSLHVPRYISADGSRVFFETANALVLADSNGRRDVYEYEEGHLYAVSNVTGSSDSYLLDASPSGDDVFIATADQLVGGDTDGFVDAYDARVGGGFPAPVAAPECDNGDSCRAPVLSQPGVFGAPATATFAGPGNSPPVVAQKPEARVKPKLKPKPKRCGRGLARRHGRCVRPKARRSRSANGSGRSRSANGSGRPRGVHGTSKHFNRGGK